MSGAEIVNHIFDLNGNITGIGNKILAYNQDNRLVRAEEGGTVLGEYIYNGLGQRIIKAAGGTTTVFLYDFDGNIIAETDQTGSISKEYLYKGSSRLAMVDVLAGKMYYYGNDKLGTPQIMTDSTNTIVWEADYKPFGEADVNPNSTVANNFRFPGQYYDNETGLHYNYHRYYDPSTGRYVTPDPSHFIQPDGTGIPYLVSYLLKTPQEMNNYSSVLNNPLNFIDPLGLACGSGWKQIFIPDNWFGWYSFEGPCSNHDSCYGCDGALTNKSQSDCDYDFYQEMLSECENLKKQSYWQTHCQGTALIYYNKVVNKGQPYFDAARKNCCNK